MTSLLDAAAALRELLNTQRQANRLLRLSFPRNDAPEGALLAANGLQAWEGLSKDFEFIVEVLSERPDIALKDVLGKMVTIELVCDDGSVRYFNGHVFSFGFLRNDAGFAFYEMVLRPWLAFLHYRQDNRAFHDETVRGQTEAVFAHYDARDWKTEHLNNDVAMTYACQFDETDHNYLHRRWEALGWHYRYEHRADGHTLVLSGDSVCSPPLDGSGQLQWRGEIGSGLIGCGLWALSATRTVASTAYAAAGFDFKSPRPRQATVPTRNEQGKVPPLEVYEYAGAYPFKDSDDAYARNDADVFVRRRIEEIEGRAKTFEAQGNDAHMQCGRSFVLIGHLPALNADLQPGHNEFLVLEVQHSANNNYEVREGGASRYSSIATVTRKKVPWRPGRGFHSTDTRIYGLQTAIVVGGADQQICTDEHGRVRVQFHWDREGSYNTASSAWIRVASTFAGQQFGQIALPRVGDEVVVEFLDGNPDRPLVTGRVFNARHMPPAFSHVSRLPADHALSGWSSRELQGTRLQQLRFDDTQGQISTQLASEHGDSQLNQGWVGTPRQGGQSTPRGEGLEAYSRAAAALRGERGVLVSAEALPGEASAMLYRSALIGLAQAVQSMQQQLAQLGATHNAGEADVAKLTQLVEQIKNLENGSNTAPDAPGGGTPMVAIHAPAGVAVAAGDSLLLAAQTHLDALSVGNTQIAAGRHVLVYAGEGANVFAHSGGVRVVTAQADVDVRADSGNVILTAAKRLVLRAGEAIDMEAPVIRGITTGAQVDIGNGQITQQSSGAHVIKAASFAQTGPGGGSPPGLQLPTSMLSTDERYVLRLQGSGAPAANRRYRIDLSDGPSVSGRSDAQGRTSLANTDAIRIAAVTLFDD
jgi:type VI secretion system secreted protein VgrG